MRDASSAASHAAAAPLWSRRAVRLRVVCLISLALTIEGLMRTNLHMAYVCMVADAQLEPARASLKDSNDSCPVLSLGNTTAYEYKGTLEWTSGQRAFLFPVFYVGGLAATLSCELLNRKLGASRVVLYGAVVNVVGTLSTPAIAVHLGPASLAIVRFFMGFGQGVLMPCMSVLVAAWFPVYEKSTALAIATTGNQLSIIFGLFFTAELCQLPLFGGWPLAFYIYGALGVVLVVLWWLVVADSPAASKAVSDAEKQLILGTNSSAVPTSTVHSTSILARNRKPPKTRWSALLSSLVVWSICASSFCHNFIVVGIAVYLPFYYKSALNMSLTSNGLLSALPFICQFISKVLFASFADISKRRRWMSVTAATKLCNSTASFGIAGSFVFLSLCDCSSRWLAVAAACTAMAFVSGFIPGYSTSVVCVAPSQTAGVAAISRFWAQVGMTLAPWLIGVYIRTGSIDEWRVIFVGMAALCFLTGGFFQLCGSASLQPWNDEKKRASSLLADASKNSGVGDLKQMADRSLLLELGSVDEKALNSQAA